MKLFYLQKSDRSVILILLVVIGAALAVIHFTDSREDEPLPKEQPATKQKTKKAKKQYYYQPQGQKQEGELFAFDPNSADSAQLLRLGLEPWQVRNIYKYRQAGGIYRKPSDFARLYGLTVKQYRRLEPYIRISNDYQPAATLFPEEEPVRRDSARYPIKLKQQERMVLNLADTASLRKIPGIGPYFARKIVEYRKRLGGFYSVRQLLEIEDFPEKAIDYFIIPDSTLPQHRLEVNRMSLNELKRHPYINFYQAKAIVDYRRQRGPLKSLQQLKLLKDFPPEAIERLEPYVSY